MDGQAHIDAQESDASAAPTKAKKVKKAKMPRQRELSTIGFPYLDLDSAISVPRALLEKGAQPLTRDQLAAAMNQTPGSGNFMLKLGSARMFGLVETTSQNTYKLTALGFDIVDKDEQRVKNARARAFLTVPLYARTYADFKGKQLPPRPHGLEQAFVQYGVSSKQKDKARQAFDKSAMQAGFFANGKNDRLVEPVIAPAPDIWRGGDKSDLAESLEQQLEAEGEIAPVGTKHPFITGLIQSLPEPLTVWSNEAREEWLSAAKSIFKLIYKLPAPTGGKGDLD